MMTGERLGIGHEPQHGTAYLQSWIQALENGSKKIRAAVLFFQLINARHERASTVLTSNKGFEEWGHVLGDEIMAAALIDRLLHHCHIVNIRGHSYRMREHQHWLRTASDEQREGVAT